MSAICCLTVTATRSALGCARRGRSRMPTWPSSACSCSRQSSTARGPTRPARCARAWADTLTLMRLGITGNLAQTLCSTNPCESMIEILRHTQRNVKRWRDGDMRKRWTAAGMLVAEQQFRRIIGYRDLAKLVIAIERHATLVAARDQVRQENREPVTV